MLGSSLTTEVVYRNGLPIVHATGEVDLATAPLLRTVLASLVSDGRPSIVLDLGHVSYLDASGLNVLVGIRRELIPHGGTLKLINPGRSVARVIRMIGLDAHLPIFHSVDQALVTLETDRLLATANKSEMHRLEIAIHSRPELVGKVRTAIDRVARRDGLSPEEAEDLQLVVSEACTNAILHGSPLGSSNTVLISYQREPSKLIIEVEDEGPGFALDHDDVVWPDGFEEGRRGLFLIRTLMDRVEYDRNGDTGGVLRMVKHCNMAGA